MLPLQPNIDRHIFLFNEQNVTFLTAAFLFTGIVLEDLGTNFVAFSNFLGNTEIAEDCGRFGNTTNFPRHAISSLPVTEHKMKEITLDVLFKFHSHA